MSVNTVPFQQSATILNSIVQQATGRSAVISTEPDFISVAQTALSLPNDVIINAISGVLARSIFINRPYTAKLKGLQKDMPTWGAYMRKLGVIEDDWDDNAQLAHVSAPGWHILLQAFQFRSEEHTSELQSL